MSRFYRFYHYLAKVLFWLLTRRVRVRGVYNVPRSGPAILISNHLSYSDPASIIGFVPRQVFFMAKSEMFDGGFMDWVVTKAEAFPVKRGQIDMDAMRHAVAILKRGDLLGIYPEGTRSNSHRIREGRAGVITIARQSGAPIIPVAITGMEHVFRRRFPWIGRPDVTITIGPPVTLAELAGSDPRQADREQLAGAAMERIARLLPPDYQSPPLPASLPQP
ncbi:MAG TPA: lysophospholipid acyltransferase family protein [Herpetosiphonaceae bacterium]